MWNLKRLAALAVILPVLAPEPSALYARTRKGERLLAQGREAENRRDYDKALEYYEQAVSTDPSDPAYVLASRRVRFQAGQMHVDRGQRLRNEGKLEEALDAFRKAYVIDPSSSIAEQEFRRIEQMLEREKQRKEQDPKAPPVPAEERGLTPAQIARRHSESRASAMLGVPELKPMAEPFRTLKIVNQSPKVLYETVGKLATVNILFDADYTDQGKKFTLDLNGANLEEALDYVALVTKTFWKPLSENTIFVTADNVTKRRDYEEHVTRVFYLQNVTSPQELQEAMTAMRTITDVRKVFPFNSQSAIVVRGTSHQVALAERVLMDLDKPKPEVLVDVLVMEANRTRTRDLATAIMSAGRSGLAFPISRTAAAGAAVPLNALGRVGTGDWAIAMPGALLQALAADRQTRILTTPQLRATDGQKAALRLGDRVPYATGSFQPGIGAVGVSPLVSTQFNFAEVGVNFDITPRIHGGDEVSMQIEFEISNIRERIDIGGLSQPVIGQRKVNHIIRVREGETTLIGGLMQAMQSVARAGIPGLMNIPGLGRMFTTENVENMESELLVALIPHIVRGPEISGENVRPVASGTDAIWKLNFAPRPVNKAETGKPEPPRGEPPKPLPPALPQGLQQLPAGAPKPAGTKPAAPLTGAEPPPPAAAPAVSPDEPAAAQAPAGAPAAAPAVPALVLTPAAGEFVLGQPVVVTVQVRNVTGLFTAPMKITYDNKVLRLAEAVRGPFLGSDGQQVIFNESRDDEQGVLTISTNRVPGTGGISGSGILFTLRFQAIGRGPAAIKVEEPVLRDSTLKGIDIQPPALTVTVK
jgi:general secretion pathway protein D